MTKIKARAAVVGALVADAATMGFHWLYDQDRIAALAGAAPEFRAPNARDFRDDAGESLGYFAHGGKRAGEVSHYGAQMLAMCDALAAKGRFDAEAYAAAFRIAFGYGGSWVGYIDRPTRQTLNAMAKAEAEERSLATCGADDDQLPALAKLPPLVARHHADADLLDLVETAVRVTNDRDDAAEWGRSAALIMKAAIEGAAPRDAAAAGRGISAKVDGQIEDALARGGETVEAVATSYALHCRLDVAFPVMIHAIASADDYEGAVRANIRAGGDNCGRSILIGAVLGACFADDPALGVPAAWLARTEVPGALLAGL